MRKIFSLFAALTLSVGLWAAAPANVESVDLGLPSGLKWATFNVGATAPEGNGDYFAWGETEPYYSSQDPLTWKTGKETGYDWQSYCGSSKFTEWSTTPYDATTKNLKPEFDAATANWGSDWRMPTMAEYNELMNNCTWTWTADYNGTGIKGYIVTSKAEGNTNSIFLPASGFRYDLTLDYVGSEGYYWSSSLYEGASSDAYSLYLSSVDLYDYDRYFGQSVRPVTTKLIVPAPELTAPQVPTVDVANVKAIMCETYNNNLGYWPQGWGGCNWVDTCIAGVNFEYTNTMAWDCFASDWQNAGVADYANLHFDIWFAEDGNAPVVKLEFNGTDPTAQITIPGEFKAGWNSVNVNVAETFGEQPMNNLKCLTIRVTKEGGPVAWANILFFNGDYTSTEATGTCAETPVWPEDAPATAPAAPAHDGASIIGAELTTSYAFEPLDWPGAMPQLLTFETGETIYYMSKMTWQMYTNWAADFYDVSEYNMLHVDLYPATGTEIKIVFEGLYVDDGGQGYKNSVVKALTAGQWNALDIALSEFPALTSGDPYDFSDIRYFILEGYNAEQSALTVGNVYFYSDPTALPTLFDDGVKANKSLLNGQLIIRKDGKTFNALGQEVK